MINDEVEVGLLKMPTMREFDECLRHENDELTAAAPFHFEEP